MDEAKKEGAEKTPLAGTPPAEEQKAQVPDESKKEETLPEGGTEGKETSDLETSERHTTRAERRIRNLVEKLKERGEEQKTTEETEMFGLPWEQQEPQSPFEGVEETIDPDELKGRIDKYVSALTDLRVKQIMSEKERESAYRQAVNDWLSDLEKTIQENPELKEGSPEYNAELSSTLAELIETVNFTPNGLPVPTIKASELYKRFKKVLEKERLKAQDKVSVSLIEKMGEEAIKPTPGKEEKGYSLEQLRKIMAKKPGEVAKILKETLPTVED